MLTLLFVLCFIVQYILSYGMYVGHHLKKYEELDREDAGTIVLFAFITGILLGFGLFFTYCMTGFASGGLKYVNPFTTK